MAFRHAQVGIGAGTGVRGRGNNQAEAARGYLHLTSTWSHFPFQIVPTRLTQVQSSFPDSTHTSCEVYVYLLARKVYTPATKCIPQQKCIPECKSARKPLARKVYAPARKVYPLARKRYAPCEKSVPPCKKKVCPLREKCTPLGRKVYPPCKKNVPPLQEKCQEKCTPLLCLIMTLIYRHTCHTRGEARTPRVRLGSSELSSFFSYYAIPAMLLFSFIMPL